jgi:hypothetical protein
MLFHQFWARGCACRESAWRSVVGQQVFELLAGRELQQTKKKRVLVGASSVSLKAAGGRAVCRPAGSSSIRVDRIWSIHIRSCGSCQHKQEQIAAKKTSWQSPPVLLTKRTHGIRHRQHIDTNTHARNTRESEFQNLYFQLQLLDLSAECTRSRYEFARYGNNKLRQLAF